MRLRVATYCFKGNCTVHLITAGSWYRCTGGASVESSSPRLKLIHETEKRDYPQ